MTNPFERIKGLPKVEEIEEIAFRRASESAKKIPFHVNKLVTAKKREKARIQTLCANIERYFKTSLEIIEALEKADIFYRQFARIFFPDEEVKRARGKIISSIRIVRKLSGEYLRKIDRVSNVNQFLIVRKKAYGRMASVLKRGKKQIELVREIWLTMRKLPTISRNTPTIVVAGPPNVGKSSLVRKVSTAKVEVASYPFTTKEISIGHFTYEKRKYQIMDTPGLLDRPMEKRNLIEKKTIICLRHAADLIVFMFDVSGERYYSVREQINLYMDIKSIFEGRTVIPVINKVDAVEKEDDIHEIEKAVNLECLKISVKKGWGIKRLIKEVSLKTSR